MGTGFIKDVRIVVLAMVAVFLAGCATGGGGPTSKTAPSGNVTTEAKGPSIKGSDTGQEKIIVQNGRTYRLVKTPFGYMRHLVQAPRGVADVQLPVPTQATLVTQTGETQKVKEQKGLTKGKVTAKPRVATISSKQPRPSEDKSAGVVLNFDDADIYEVIRVLADLLKINYIVDPTVRGKVTIHTAGKLSQNELWPVFHRILEVNGLTIVQERGLYRITPLKGASGLPIPSVLDLEQRQGIPPAEKVVIQVIPLKHVAAREMVKLLKPFVSANGLILPNDQPNMLLVVDRGGNILKILELVDAFDLDLFDRFHYRFYQLTYSEAKEVAKTLESVLSPVAKKAKATLKIVGIERLNMLIVMSSTQRVFQDVDRIVKRLDIPSEIAEPKIYVYYVKNGEAKQLAQILNQVFSESSSAAKKKKMGKEGAEKPRLMGNPLEKKASSEEKGEKQAPGASPATSQEVIQGVASGTLKGEIRIVADEVRNALIIEALPSDYRTIKSILDKIDVLPRQVLIELTIAEISLDATSELGLEWSFKKAPGSPHTTLLNATMGSSGLQYTIGEADRWSAVLSALATENKLNILSSPSILASDNKEAVINISTEVPVASSEYQYTSGTEPVIQTNIQYRNTGLILSVTPHINDRGLVTMAIKQEVSDQSQNVSVGGHSYPSFFKRSVDTTLTVKHGQTVVIGGLMKQNKGGGTSGVPWLVKIPILGFLFGKKTASFSKSELILLITPHVITTLDEVDAITEEFKTKVSNVMKLMIK